MIQGTPLPPVDIKKAKAFVLLSFVFSFELDQQFKSDEKVLNRSQR